MSVDVTFSETPKNIQVIITNLGPALDQDEIERIFDLGVCGKNAIAAGLSGFGIGLFLVRDLVQRSHRGKIEFRQTGDATTHKGVPYRTSEVVLTFERVG